MTPEEQLQFDNLKQEVETLKSLFYQNNYSDLQVFIKKVQFNSDVKLGTALGFTPVNGATATKLGFFTKYLTPVVQQGAVTVPSGGATQDAESRTAIGQIITALKNLGLTL